ncbi:MAG: hypothetical protein ACTJHU_08855, partial [Mycetocola sp.]
MDTRYRWVAAGGAIIAGSVLMTGCSPGGDAHSQSVSFARMDEAYAAVDGVIGCTADADDMPVAPMDGSATLATDQRMCVPLIQLDLYADHDAVRDSLEVWSRSEQGEVHVVSGDNWMLVDLSRIDGGQASEKDLSAVADELGGRYEVV